MEDLLDSGQAALDAHCRRTALWAFELAQALGMNPVECEAVREAGLHHHWPAELITGEGFSKLVRDLGFNPGGGSHAPMPSKKALEILREFERQESGCSPGRCSQMAEVLGIANEFDEQLEFAPYEGGSLARILDGTLQNPVMLTMRATLRHSSRAEVEAQIPRLPIYPSVAMQALRLACRDDVDLGDLEAVAGRDPVLAGRIVAAANAVSIGMRYPVLTLSHAVSCLGLEEGRRILAAAAVAPLYASSHVAQLWRHSLQAAEVAERLAALSKRCDPARAFLAGLLHDIGRLAIVMLERRAVSCLERLISNGCPVIPAEALVCGLDHAQAGSTVLLRWGVAEQIAAAIEYHHEPEHASDTLSALIYLTEFCTGGDEDLPSAARLQTACARLGLTTVDLHRIGAIGCRSTSAIGA